MSLKIEQVYQTYFSPLVKEAYQGTSILRQCVRIDGDIIGNTAEFRKAGSVKAVDINRGADLDYANADYSKVVATLHDKVAPDLVYNLDQNKVNFKEAKGTAFRCASAIGRAVDQIIIDDALNKTTTSAIGTEGTALTVETIINAAEILSENNVPEDERFMLVTPAQVAQLLRDPKITSRDYTEAYALQTGQLKPFMGFTFIKMGRREEGGLPKQGSRGVKAFAFHKSALGVAMGEDIKTRMDWVPTKLAHQIACTVSVGAVNIDDKGILPIISKKSNA